MNKLLGWRPVIFRLNGGSHYQYVTYGCSSYGPTFGGGHVIQIASEASSSKNSPSNLGNAYNPPSGHSHGSEFTTSFLAGSSHFKPDEVEVFYETGYK